MNAIHTTATLGIDGMLHVPIPGAKPGVEYDVTVRSKPVSNVLLAGEVLKDFLGILDEETEFERPPRDVTALRTLGVGMIYLFDSNVCIEWRELTGVRYGL